MEHLLADDLKLHLWINTREEWEGKKSSEDKGKWKDQTSILMVSLYLIKCHKILDHHKVEVHAVIVECFHKETISAVSTGQEESKILMSVTNGDQDILKDNGTYNTKWWCLYSSWGY